MNFAVLAVPQSRIPRRRAIPPVLVIPSVGTGKSYYETLEDELEKQGIVKKSKKSQPAPLSGKNRLDSRQSTM